MKKGLWKGLLIASAAIALGTGLVFAGCSAQNDDADAVSQIYAQAVELGYEGFILGAKNAECLPPRG